MTTASVRQTGSAARPASGLLIALDASATDTLQQQVCAAIRAAILEGRLQPGSKLPSSRALATDLEISRTTTSLAYEQLTSEGYLQGRRGSGTFVARELPDDLPRVRTEHRRLRRAPRCGATGRLLPPSHLRRLVVRHPFRLGAGAGSVVRCGRFRRSSPAVATMAQLDYGDPWVSQLRQCTLST
jgi:GntR family transcriptional regulator/MocR family aminotransferase